MALAIVSGLAGVVATGDLVQAETLTVAAAHSLKAAFDEILPMFESEYGATIHVVYGPSKTLRRQIEKGAPIDVFLPEAVEEVEELQKKGLTLNGGPRIYAQTSLVLVMSAASPTTPISFRECCRIEQPALPSAILRRPHWEKSRPGRSQGSIPHIITVPAFSTRNIVMK